MAIFKEFAQEDFIVEKDVLEQVVDFLQSDISSSLSRKQYGVWISGGLGPGITSSLFQTVFDQDFSMQTANALFDVTFGLSSDSKLVNTGSLSSIDSRTGKYYFSSQSVQMREKMDIYRSLAQNLLGDADSEFTIVTGSSTITIREPMFILFKRLFTRDRIKRESFAIRLHTSSSVLESSTPYSVVGEQKIYTDNGSATNIEQSYGGQVSVIVDSAQPTYPVGLLYLDKGICVLDTMRIFNTSSNLTGTIDAISPTGRTPFNGTIKQFYVSASIDNMVDYTCSMLFGSGSLTGIVMQNETFINSSIVFCRIGPDYFNYSSNPTYVDSTGRIIVIDPGQEDTQRSFTFITKIGLYDSSDNLSAVASLSRPVYNARDRDFGIKIRLDYWFEQDKHFEYKLSIVSN
mgnify:CR=1 FL=1